MRQGKYPIPSDSGANICFFCRRACGGCSWSAFDPAAGRPRFQPVPGWTAEPVKLSGPEAGRTRYADTWHITACPLFALDRPGKPGRPRKVEKASARKQTSGASCAQGERSHETMPKRRKPRLCSRFYCGSREGKFCCADCRLRRRCENSCLNDPSRCGLEEKGPRGVTIKTSGKGA